MVEPRALERREREKEEMGRVRGAFHRLQKQKASVSSARYFVGGGGRGAGGMRGVKQHTKPWGCTRPHYAQARRIHDESPAVRQ